MQIKPLKIIDKMPGYSPMVSQWLGALQEGRQRTLKVLHNLPPEILDWFPANMENSIGTLLYHLAAIEMD